MRKYVFKPYNAIYPSLFTSEKKRLKLYVAETSVIEHFGSTAIPELGGKGIIDIYIAVPKEQLQTTADAIIAAGYEFRKTASIPEEHLFFKIALPDPLEQLRTYHVHLTYPEYYDWENALAFRDYLRSHPEEVKKYAEIKKHAAKIANEDKNRYMEIKSPFIKEILEKRANPH